MVVLHYYTLIVLYLLILPSYSLTPFEHFENYNTRTSDWIKGGKESKVALQDAMQSISYLVPWLVQQPTLPPGLDPLAFAANILAFHQTNDHISSALPLLKLALQSKVSLDDQMSVSIEDACMNDITIMRRTCQDLYTLLIANYHRVGRIDEAQKYLHDYNLPRPQARRFVSPEWVHRQLPYIRAQPWWNEDTTDSGIPIFLNGIRSRYNEIRDEVLAVTTAEGFNGWGMNQDLRLATNPAWDPLTSWDAIPIHANGQWVEETCEFLPHTCKVLKSFSSELDMLFNRSAYNDLVGMERLAQDYTEVPTLGIKLYRVWNNAGIKPHTGSPGRLVHSLTLQGPRDPSSTLTVAGITKEWVEGEFLSFDDSFYHSVDNPHLSTQRIVLAFVTMHPDLIHSPVMEMEEATIGV